MPKSMTAYGRAEVKLENATFICEVQSVNRKGLEITSHFPKELLALETPVKKMVRSGVSRGQILLRLSVDQSAKIGSSNDLLKNLHSKMTTLAKELDPNYQISFDTLLSIAEKHASVQKAELSELQPRIEEGFKEALQNLSQMKADEGKELVKDLTQRLGTLKELAASIESAPKTSSTSYRDKLEKRIAEIGEVTENDRDRILKELAIYAEKIDITEELVRLKSHLAQFSNLLQKEDGAVGKTLEFLLQEIMRETNTLSSKSPDLPIIQKALDMKGEIERIREQLQNIE